MRAFSGARCRDCPVKMPEAGILDEKKRFMVMRHPAMELYDQKQK